ncbi:MAG: hypothetical protein ACRDTU_13720 [Micromonosporaceae bacterium]
MTTENVQDLQYHIEAIYFVNGPCDVHVDITGMTADVRAQVWIDRLCAAARTAKLRQGRLCVCRPPAHLTQALTLTSVAWCDNAHHPSPKDKPRTRPRIRLRHIRAG